MNRGLWTALASGVWDACLFEEERLCAEVYDLVQHARETQPHLALLVAAEEEASAFDATLVSGNLLDPAIERTYGKKGDQLYSSYKRGMTFGISMGYDF